MVDVVEVLTKARERLRGRWYQGFYYDERLDFEGDWYDTCRVCALGAVRWAVAGSPHVDAITLRHEVDIYKAARLLTKTLSDGLWITAFNDAKGRTEDEVLAAFDKAIELAKVAS